MNLLHPMTSYSPFKTILMSDIIDNTFTAYLGPEFQQRLMWQLLVEPEFAEKTIPELAVEYFDDPYIKKLYLIMLEFLKEYDKVPNLQNQSILQAVNQFKAQNNVIEEESLFSVIERIKLWNERVLNKSMLHDGDVIQKATNIFIKQQEYRKIGEFILTKTKSGEIKNKRTIAEIEERFQKIAVIGDTEDNGTDVSEGIRNALRKEFRQTIPTGIETIDALTGGGLGKGEIGLILTPSGVGKTTILTKIANTARELDKNVLQIVFEDTEDQIKRKHYTIWSGVGLSDIDDNNEVVIERVEEKISKLGNNGRLTIMRFSQEDTTLKDIRKWIDREQKKGGFKFDIVVLDYLDCLESHKKTADRNESELVIIKSFEAMASDLNIPCWSAIQSNRSGLDAELVEAHQSGGSIKRLQKAHFFMSVAKTPDQKEAHLANIRIIKARFAQDGQTFKDCIFNNNTMEIIIRDERYPSGKNNAFKKQGDAELQKLENKASSYNMHVKISEKVSENIDNGLLNDYTDYIKTTTEPNTNFENEGINEGVSEGVNNGASDGVNDTANNTANDAVLLEIDDTPPVCDDFTPIEIQSVEHGRIITDDPFEWTGETQTINVNVAPEVKLEDIPPLPIVEVQPPPQPKVDKSTLILDELTSLLEGFDDDDDEDKQTKERLAILRRGQNVITKT